MVDKAFLKMVYLFYRMLFLSSSKEKGESLPKFFAEKERLEQGTLHVVGGDAVHMGKVLRLTQGSRITLCDGEGTDYEAEITAISKEKAECRVLRSYPCETEPNIQVTLFQGIPKAAKMEYIIQKCTELGITAVVPIMTKRTVVKLENEKAEGKKLERWNKISAEAVKQCGRGTIPKVYPVMNISDLCRMAAEFDLLLVAYEEETEMSLRQVLQKAESPKKIGIIIGPEGGFEAEEVKALSKAGAVSVSLGKRILRTETAGHTVLTAVMYEFGELESQK